MAKTSGNSTTGKRGTRNEARRDTSTTPLKSDGKALTNIVPPKLSIAGHEIMVGILTLSQQSTCPTWQPGNSDPDSRNSLVLGVNSGPQPGSAGGRNDFPQAAHKLTALQREQGRVVPDIFRRLREQHRHIQ